MAVTYYELMTRFEEKRALRTFSISVLLKNHSAVKHRYLYNVTCGR